MKYKKSSDYNEAAKERDIRIHSNNEWTLILWNVYLNLRMSMNSNYLITKWRYYKLTPKWLI